MFKVTVYVENAQDFLARYSLMMDGDPNVTGYQDDKIGDVISTPECSE